ncbi:hypothetical protein [Nakamurella alba]|uniref:hypothetical protein n=1 Tax=Nakamurella alba TaxID=2665158 RepID=UPI001E5AB819|nr:hypothetical protein [Nakamurella alba]
MDDATAAARNNARWCDAVCRSHGVVTEFSDDIWCSTSRSPVLYPDAVTLSPRLTEREVLARIDAGAGASVKDSFATLDLTTAGFELLFDATWIRLDSTDLVTDRWSEVRDVQALRAFAADHGGGEVFRPSLLDDQDVAVLSDGRGSGAIANVSDQVVGMSNTFGPDLAGAVAAIAAAFPARPLVGYDRGEKLDVLLGIGFRAVGPLRVWLKP